MLVKRSAESLWALVSSPLGFFILALLTIEGVLGIALGTGSADDPYRPWYVAAGIGMFVFTVLVFAAFLAVEPERLTFGANAYLRKAKKSYGTSANPKDAADIENEPSQAAKEAH